MSPSRFNGRTVPEIGAMARITVDDFTSSVAYREIFGLGRQEGEQKGWQAGLQEGRQAGLQEGQEKGRQAEAVALTLRQLQLRCGALTPSQQARIQALSLTALETLSVALLDFQGPDDLTAWLSQGLQCPLAFAPQAWRRIRLCLEPIQASPQPGGAIRSRWHSANHRSPAL